MLYKYITEDNLENKQTYMYSEYGGRDFLAAYRQERQSFCKTYAGTVASLNLIENNVVSCELMYIRDRLYQQEKCFTGLKKKIDAYNKAFEVRKRVYTAYDEKWKPLPNAGYRHYASYLLLADILCQSYVETSNLKYLNTLLKLDDTLLSLVSVLSQNEKYYLVQIIGKEMTFVSQLAEKKLIKERLK